MTHIFLIRHGETAWNAVRRLQGHLDIALNDTGRRQAAALAMALAETHLDAVYASDLDRARATAAPLAAARGIPVHVEPRLRERCYGAFEGLLYDALAEQFPEAWDAYRRRDVDARYPAGEREAETLREFSGRSVAILRDIAARHPGQQIAVVAHGGVLECIYRHATRMSLTAPRDFPIHNASINRVHWDGECFSVAGWGEIGHLAEAARDEVAR